MALTTPILNAAADGAATALEAFGAIASDAAGTQTSNQRIAILFDPATGAVATSPSTPLAFTGTAGAAATHFAVWDLATAGTLLGSSVLTGDQTFNAAGEYNVDTITVTATDQTVS